MAAGDPAPPGPTLRELRRSLRRAADANASYLGEDHPTAAATREQVHALTEQVTTLIRMTLGE